MNFTRCADGTAREIPRRDGARKRHCEEQSDEAIPMSQRPYRIEIASSRQVGTRNDHDGGFLGNYHNYVGTAWQLPKGPLFKRGPWGITNQCLFPLQDSLDSETPVFLTI